MRSRGADTPEKQDPITLGTLGGMLGWIAAWTWTILAGGGGLWLLWTKGPLPLTNGWFALLSGLAACPLTAWLFKKYAGIPFQVAYGLPPLFSFSLLGKLL